MLFNRRDRSGPRPLPGPRALPGFAADPQGLLTALCEQVCAAMVADPALDERPWTRFSYQFLWPRDSLAGSHSGTWMAQVVRPDGQPVLTGGDFFARDLNAYWLLRRFRMARPTLERPSHFHIEGTRSSVSAPPEVTSRWLDLA